MKLIVDTTFHLKHTISIFRAKFPKKGYFRFQAGQENITTKFRIFELV